MKKLFSLVLLFAFLIMPVVASAKVGVMFAYDFIGGTTGCVDNISCTDRDGKGTDLEEGDIVCVVDDTKIMACYRYNATGTSSEDSVLYDIIVPDDRATNCSGEGQWEKMEQVNTARTATPSIIFRDSGCTAKDENVKIFTNCTDTGDGSEDCDWYVAVQEAGSDISGSPPAVWRIHIDADGDINFGDDINLASGKTIKLNTVNFKDADQDMWYSMAIPAGALIADGTNCEAPASHQVGSGPNMMAVTCDGAVDGQFEITVPMPENWDGGNIYIKIAGIKTVASPTGAVEFDVKVQARGIGDAFNTSWSSIGEADFNSTWTQNAPDFATSAVIAAGGGTDDEMLAIHCNRDADNDTSVQDIEIIGLTLFYQVDDMDDRD